MAVQARLLTPFPPAAMKVILEVTSQMPCAVQVCVTSLVRFWTLHENTGGCDGHVCLTEHETVIVEPASTSAGTAVITGFSGEAEHVNHFCQLESKQINNLAYLNKLNNYIDFRPFITINTQLLLNLYLTFPFSAWKQKGPLSKGLMSSISSEQFPSFRSPNILVRPLKWSSTWLWPLWKTTPPVFLDQMPRVRGTSSWYWKLQGITTQERVRALNLKGTSAARMWDTVKREASHDMMPVEISPLVT